jgi:hypothetical protein
LLQDDTEGGGLLGNGQGGGQGGDEPGQGAEGDEVKEEKVEAKRAMFGKVR